jgi:alkylation response protein AidB-like acyl-CoA dehydrogenase
MEAKLKQFVLGSINLDCRDSASIGHGVAIAQFASPMTAGYWCDCMKEGLLVGAAATEPQGGTSKHRFVTRMQCGPSGWRLFGRKVSISRLHEAGVFVVYAQAAAGLTAVAIDANASRIRRTERKPAGLQGWSWGVLEFQGTPFRPSDILGSPGDGHRVFAAHFSAFRPLVASTALGAAAAAWSIVQRDLRERLAAGQIARPRDTALELIAYHKTQIRNALLGVLTSSGGMAAATPEDEEAVMCAKADGVETALEAVRDLRVLVSAEKSMIAGEVFDKTLRDLEAYRFADGLNGELWRAAGKRLLA